MKPAVLLVLALAASATAAEPIQIGKERQLFLDDHLIEHTEHLVRRVQPAKKHEANPLIGKGNSLADITRPLPPLERGSRGPSRVAW